MCPASEVRSSFDEWLMLSDKAPRRVIARYGEERQRRLATLDAVKSEQRLSRPGTTTPAGALPWPRQPLHIFFPGSALPLQWPVF
ncbi:hypothetical protein E3W21_06160 [Pseudomonas sp. F01002]|nr:hypothetical protein E3W21_06160 [Pseudomonas sp. F01002]